jgi:hypothetical protein
LNRSVHPNRIEPGSRVALLPDPPQVPHRPRVEWVYNICAAEGVNRLMPKGHKVCLHCSEAQSRVANLYERKPFHKKTEDAKYLDKFQEVRKAKGMTYREIRDRARFLTGDRLAESYLYNLGTCSHRASGERIQLLARILGVEVDNLYTEEYNQQRDNVEKAEREE